MEVAMGSTPSIITVVASVVFGLIVLGIGTRLFGSKTP
jgi:hypothetical protein